MVVGQIMQALLSGKYDLHKVAIIMSQTGGGCRASNYIGFIRRALNKADMGHIPVISINLSGLESNPGFKITPGLARRLKMGKNLYRFCIRQTSEPYPVQTDLPYDHPRF